MARRSIHIEHKPYDPEGAAGQLRKALSAHTGRELTVADAAALSGAPVFNVEPGLLALAGEFPSRIRVTDDGDLLFTFDSLERPRSRAAGALAELGRRLRRVFVPTVVFLTLVLSCPLLITVGANHFALMAVIGNALAFPFFLTGFFTASGGFIWGVLMLFMVLPAIFLLMGLALVALVIVEPDGGQWAIGLIFGLPMLLAGGHYTWKNLKALPAALRSTEKGTVKFWRQVAGFIFGPVPDFSDPLADERRLTALIRDRSGVLTRADLMALFGWDARTADNELTRILVHYGGDVGVTDDGVVLYRFDELMRSTTATNPDAPGEDLRPAWERDTAAPAFFDCPQATAMWLLVLLVGGAVGLLAHPDLAFFPDADDWRRMADKEISKDLPVVLLEGAGGYLYAICLGVPLLRAPWWGVARLAHARRRAELAEVASTVEQLHDEDAAAQQARTKGGWKQVCGEVAFDTRA